MRAARYLVAAVAAAFGVTCADQSVGVPNGGIARVALAPVFATAPQGGPDIDVDSIRGVLRRGTDSSVTTAIVEGDSAVLEFNSVVVLGDSSTYNLGVKAFDNNVLVFEGAEELHLKPGENNPATPTLEYAAPDSAVASIDLSVTALSMNWAGGDTATSVNSACLSRSPSPSTSNTRQKLTVAGVSPTGAPIANVRVGWTSRDTTIFRVDTGGTVRSRCANGKAWLVARTFKDKVDSIEVTVVAPPFSLRMSPESTSVARGATRLLTAEVLDELGNTFPAAQVTWNSSDTTRAKVSTLGLVTGIANGRVLITASSANRTTVGVVQVKRPDAFKVVVQGSVLDSMALTQSRPFFAKALDSLNRVLGDAAGFQWSSSDASVATINPNTGVASAVGVGTTFIKVTLPIDNKRDSVTLKIKTALDPGTIKGTVTDAATGAALSGVVVQGPITQATSDGAGSFTLTGLQGGDDVTLTKTGYVTINAYGLPAFPGQTITVANVPMSPSGGVGTITGKVINVLSNNTVAGVSVAAYAGVNAGPTPKRPNPTAVATVTTDANGIYTFSSIDAGAYTLVFKANGYSEAINLANSVSGQSRNHADMLLPPAALGGGLFILVSWKACDGSEGANVPCDLDAHLTGPKVSPDTGRFQILASSRVYTVGGDTIAALDVDDSNGRGPEVIGLRLSAPAGQYKFYVHNFSNTGVATSRALSDSAGVRVDIYQDNRVIATYFPPPGQQGTLWNVFEYDGARLLPVGTITHPADPAILPLRLAPTKKKTD